MGVNENNRTEFKNKNLKSLDEDKISNLIALNKFQNVLEQFNRDNKKETNTQDNETDDLEYIIHQEKKKKIYKEIIIPI